MSFHPGLYVNMYKLDTKVKEVLKNMNKVKIILIDYLVSFMLW